VRAWEAAAVVTGCVFAMLRAPDSSMDRITRSGGSAYPRPLAQWPRRGWRIGLVAIVAVGATAGGGTRPVVVAIAGLGAAVAARRVIGRSRQRRTRRDRQQRVVALCDALSAELSGGLPMSSAVRRSCQPDPELTPVVAAAELGGDIAEALRRCSQRPGAEGLRAVAAAWDVAGSSGTALAGVLDRMARGLRDDDDARAEVLAALGPPRATARMLALLPVFGLGLGASIGAHPLGFLLGTSWGLGCLLGGAGLALIGLWWVERLAEAAEG
jgi:tight adherence protein B